VSGSSPTPEPHQILRTLAEPALEKERDAGRVRKVGQIWTVESWLVHWVENIAALHVSENTIDGYRVAVYHHLVPGLGAHRLAKLEPEHLERFYKKMQDNGSSAGTAHQAHRTVRAALNEAKRRRYQHLTNRVLKDTAAKVGGLLWTRPDQRPTPRPGSRVWAGPGLAGGRWAAGGAGVRWRGRGRWW
jgi:Phage integrase, N-terminal SAM-like domain